MGNAEKNKKLYRDKAIENISTPEELSGYLRVTGAGVWIVLSGIIILLAGLLVWGFFGRIISSVTVPAKVENGTVWCFVLPADLGQSDDEIEIYIGDVELTADPKDAQTLTLDVSGDEELFRSGYLSAGKNVTVLRAQSTTTLTDGYYDAEIVTDELQPIRLLFASGTGN